MLSVGMVASFLTRNLTIGFILGVAFNMPLVFMKMADVILPSRVDLPFVSGVNLARIVSNWSIAAQFDAFGRGVISLSSIVYFAMIIIVGLYLSMVLIGARHWYGGRDGHSLLGHFLLRAVAMVIVALGLTAVFSANDRIRWDMTRGKISSLSPDTRQLLKALKTDHPIYVDAFISGDVPEQYVRTRLHLTSMLKEFAAMSQGKVRVNIHDDLELFSEQAAMAEEQFGIRREPIRIRSRGTITDKEIILGAAFRCGLEKVVVPFFDYGIPVEYELIRSINTVARTKRKTIGVVRTDAQLFGGFSFAGGQPQQLPKQAIIEELEKQYDVEEVDMTQPIESGRYDVLLAVQPSSMPPEAMDYLVDAVRAGIPTAVFEDPLPAFMADVPGTGQPKMAPGGGMMGMNRPMPKADIRRLWDALGIESPGSLGQEGLFQPEIVWQRYNPYQKLQVTGIPDQWVFVREEPGEEKGLIDPNNDITSGLDELFFPYPGLIEPSSSGDLKFTTLVKARELGGTVGYEQFMMNQRDREMLRALQRRREDVTLVAHIQGEADTEKDADKKEADKKDADKDDGDSKDADKKDADKKESDGKDTDSQRKRPINVIYVTDIDLMIPAFLRIRARPDEQEDIKWTFENVTFLLNLVDVLAEERDYVNIRKRKPEFSTLKVVEQRIEEARDREFTKWVEFQTEYDKAVEKAEESRKNTLKKFEDVVSDLQKKRDAGEEIDEVALREKVQSLEEERRVQERRLQIFKQGLERKRDRAIEGIQFEVDLGIQRQQTVYKVLAVAIPWIPPFLVGLIVFVRRRLREREGIEKSRRR
jgi:ABC-2 type transport system permease protein